MMKRSLFLGASLAFASWTFAQTPVKKVFVEEFTGAWCGYCPDGAYILNTIMDGNPNVIGVAVHNGDAMVTADGNYVNNFFNTMGFPSAAIDRQGESVDRGNWSTEINARLAEPAPVAVSVDNMSWDPASRTVSATVNAHFTSAESGTLRINLVVVEDSVTGSTSSYNQTNYYNTTPSSPFYGMGNPIVGYVHRHVVRAYKGGSWGTTGIIPATVNAGEDYSRTYTFTVPVTQNIDRIHLVGMVSRYNGASPGQREVLNSEEVKFIGPMTSTGDASNSMGVSVGPNPFNDFTQLQFTLQNNGNVALHLHDALGRDLGVLQHGFMNAGTHSLTWDGRDIQGNTLANGLYFLHLEVENGASHTERVILAR